MSKKEEEKKKGSFSLFGLISSIVDPISNSDKKKKDQPKHPPKEPKKKQYTLGKPITEQSTGVSNNNHDNFEHNLIVRENEMIDNRYRVTKNLGKGVYGIVIEAIDTLVVSESKKNHLKEPNQNKVAIKIIKNHPLFHRQARVEIRILEDLNRKFERNRETARIVHLLRRFTYRGHLCLVFECLGKNLFELIQWRGYRGLPLEYIQLIAKQLLICLVALEKGNVIHCDLKPENVLLVNNEVFEMKNWNPDKEERDLMDDAYVKRNRPNYAVKVIDFGSACYEHSTSSWYIQSRFYRAPEVLLGIDYDCKIDLWSFGCIIAELYLGIPIFPGCSGYDQIAKIVDILGIPNPQVIEQGKYAGRFFMSKHDSRGRVSYTLKTEKQYCMDTGEEQKGGKKYFKETSLDLIIMKKEEALVHNSSKKKKGIESADKTEEEVDFENKQKNLKLSLRDFLGGLLRWDLSKRWTCEQVLKHPFITGEAFLKPFRPKYSSSGSRDIPIAGSSRRQGFQWNHGVSPTRSGTSSSSSSSKHSFISGGGNTAQGSYYENKPMLGFSPQTQSSASQFSVGSPPFGYNWYGNTQTGNSPPFVSYNIQNGSSSGSGGNSYQFSPNLDSHEISKKKVNQRKKRSLSLKSKRSFPNNKILPNSSGKNHQKKDYFFKEASLPSGQSLFNKNQKINSPQHGYNSGGGGGGGSGYSDTSSSSTFDTYSDVTYDFNDLSNMKPPPQKYHDPYQYQDNFSYNGSQETQFFMEMPNSNNSNNSNNSSTPNNPKYSRRRYKKKRRSLNPNNSNRQKRYNDEFSYMGVEEEEQMYNKNSASQRRNIPNSGKRKHKYFSNSYNPPKSNLMNNMNNMNNMNMNMNASPQHGNLNFNANPSYGYYSRKFKDRDRRDSGSEKNFANSWNNNNLLSNHKPTFQDQKKN